MIIPKGKIAFMDEQTTENTLEALRFLMENRPNQIRIASMRRAIMLENIKNGILKEDPREIFCISTAMEIINLLAKKGEEFQKENPHDVCLVADLQDVLVRASKKLKLFAEKKTTPPPVQTRGPKN